MRYGSLTPPRATSPPPTLPPLIPAAHTLAMDINEVLISAPAAQPPMIVIDDFDSRRVRFGPIVPSKVGGGKLIEVYYLTKADVLVKPVITTTKLRVPFDTKPYPGSDSLNLVMNLPESSALFHTLRRLDGLTLKVYHHLMGSKKSIDVYEELQSKMLTIKPDSKYDATFKMKLTASTQIKDIESKAVIEAQNLRSGDAYAQFLLSQIWIMPQGNFGLQGRALRVKWLPFVNKIDALGDWTVAEEAAPSLMAQFSN